MSSRAQVWLPGPIFAENIDESFRVISQKDVQNDRAEVLALGDPTIFTPLMVDADFFAGFDESLLAASLSAIHFARLAAFSGLEKQSFS